jgi:hypothetical protein
MVNENGFYVYSVTLRDQAPHPFRNSLAKQGLKAGFRGS